MYKLEFNSITPDPPPVFGYPRRDGEISYLCDPLKLKVEVSARGDGISSGCALMFSHHYNDNDNEQHSPRISYRR
jgi:hypothetical protein